MSTSETTSKLGIGDSLLGRPAKAALLDVASGSVPEWPKGTGCKPVALPLRWFESNPAHPALRASREGARPIPARAPRPAARACSSEHPLHQDDVEPAAELAADLALGADRLEAARARAARSTRRGRRRCGRSRSGTRGRVPSSTSSPSSSRADALAPAVAVHVDRVLDGRSRTPAGAGTATATRSRRPSPSPSTATIAGCPPECSSIHGQLVVERAGHEVERDRRLERPRGCRSPGSPRRRGARRGGSACTGRRYGRTLRNGRRRAAAARLSLSGFAPLAQSAEHFHGKEGVYGSSP